RTPRKSRRSYSTRRLSRDALALQRRGKVTPRSHWKSLEPRASIAASQAGKSPPAKPTLKPWAGTSIGDGPARHGLRPSRRRYFNDELSGGRASNKGCGPSSGG